MNIPSPISDEPFLKDDFSLVLGGPLFQLWQRTRLTGDALQMQHRRVLVVTLVSWVPLLVLSVAEGHAWGGSVTLTFVQDVENHVRLLLTLPLLIVAERVVYQLMRPLVEQFVKGGLVPDAARAKFAAALASSLRLRNSIAAEVLLIAFVCSVGMGFTWRAHAALDVASWYGVAAAGKWQPSLAGWWLGLVSLPLFQFMVLRWYVRLFIWARFLWQVSRIELTFIPTHPDKCGGLGFLALVNHMFAPLLLAQGTLLAGMIADRIFHAGAMLTEFRLELVGLAAVMVLAVLGPLLVFAPRLAAVKRAGLREYGALGQRYVSEFDQKWLRGGAPAGEPLIGSGDIQSLSDLSYSFEQLQGMRLAPFALRTPLYLAVVTLLPVAPLVLTMFSVNELLGRLLKIF